MKEKNFKFRECFAKLVGSMTDKQAGEFIKGISGYVFFGKPLETKDDFLKGIFIYAQSMLDTEMRDRANGKLGGAIMAERLKGMQGKTNAEQNVYESNLVSQVIIVSAEDDKRKESVEAMKRKNVG